MCEHHGDPVAEYAKVIYRAWDAEGKHNPPFGFANWMAYWEFKYGKVVKNDLSRSY